jgi:SSS family transporter
MKGGFVKRRPLFDSGLPWSLAFMFCMGFVSRPGWSGEETPPTYFTVPDGEKHVRVRELPKLPKPIQGAFCGAVNGAVIVAGGVSEIPGQADPKGWPFLDTVYVLPPPRQSALADERTVAQKVWDYVKPLIGIGRSAPGVRTETFEDWRLASAKLEAPTAFGAAAVRGDALICLGGLTPSGATDRVFRILCKEKDGRFEVTVEKEAVEKGPEITLPKLSQPIAFLSARVMDDSLYLAGGLVLDDNKRLSNLVYALEFPKAISESGGLLGPLKNLRARLEQGTGEQPRPKWQPVPLKNPDGAQTMPLGEGLAVPLLDVRREEGAYRDALYLIGGWRAGPQEGQYTPSRACWKFIPGKEVRAGWKRLADLPEGIEPVTSRPLGPSHLLLLANHAPKRELGIQGLAGIEGNSLFFYHTYTDTWAHLHDLPAGAFSGLCPLGDGALLLGRMPDPSAGQGPASRGIEVIYEEKAFGVINVLVVYGFFGLLVAIGYWCKKKDATTAEYFLGGGKIPWWASGLSMWATGVSAISLMLIPSKTYATDWTYMWLGIFPPILLSLSAFVFMPILRRLTIMSLTEYFELRFHPSIRLISSFLGVLSHTGVKMSVGFLAPALALSAVTGWDVFFCIIIMAVVTTLYTVVGGMEAVIWADVVQAIIMFAAPILTLAVLIGGLEGGFGEFLQTSLSASKFRLLDTSFDFTVATFWVFCIWSVTQVFGMLNQETMQRAWSTEGIKSAKRSVYTLAAVSLPGTLLFYTIGTALYAHYLKHPQELNPAIQTDAIFPYYIVQNLPPGLAGLMIAAIFAAAISMAMNTSSTIITRDFFRFFRPEAPEPAKARFAWWCTLVTGVLAALIALVLATFKSSSLWDSFMKLMSLISGGLGGVIVLGLLTRRASTVGVWTGGIIGSLVPIYLEVFTRASFFMYGTIAFAVACAAGYGVSLFFPGERRDLTGLTVWTLPAEKTG